jgi:nucleoside permease NupC
MLRIFIPIVLGLIVWIYVLWQVLVKREKIDIRAIFQLTVIFTINWMILYWLFFSLAH